MGCAWRGSSVALRGACATSPNSAPGPLRPARETPSAQARSPVAPAPEPATRMRPAPAVRQAVRPTCWRPLRLCVAGRQARAMSPRRAQGQAHPVRSTRSPPRAAFAALSPGRATSARVVMGSPSNAQMISSSATVRCAAAAVMSVMSMNTAPVLRALARQISSRPQAHPVGEPSALATSPKFAPEVLPPAQLMRCNPQ